MSRRALSLIALPGSHPSSFAHVSSLIALLQKSYGARTASLQGGIQANVDQFDCIVLQGGHIAKHLRENIARIDNLKTKTKSESLMFNISTHFPHDKQRDNIEIKNINMINRMNTQRDITDTVLCNIRYVASSL